VRVIDHVGALRDSAARNGAVMMSVAVRVGTTRLLDNVMLIGTEDDLGRAP
jgi:pantothenate synthetase